MKENNNEPNLAYTVENLEINTMYIMAMALERIADDVERRLKSQKMTFMREKKMRFNNIIKAIKAIKVNSDIIDQIDFAEGLKGRYEHYQSYQEDAYRLARIILLCADRDTGDPENLYKVQKQLRSLKGAGIITEDVLSRFYLNK
jgi:uncharacterized protein (UPF0128 family)